MNHAPPTFHDLTPPAFVLDDFSSSQGVPNTFAKSPPIKYSAADVITAKEDRRKRA